MPTGPSSSKVEREKGKKTWTEGGHTKVASFLRLDFNTEPATIVQIFEKLWKLPPPKLVITIQGGLTDFESVLLSSFILF